MMMLGYSRDVRDRRARGRWLYFEDDGLAVAPPRTSAEVPCVPVDRLAEEHLTAALEAAHPHTRVLTVNERENACDLFPREKTRRRPELFSVTRRGFGGAARARRAVRRAPRSRRRTMNRVAALSGVQEQVRGRDGSTSLAPHPSISSIYPLVL